MTLHIPQYPGSRLPVSEDEWQICDRVQWLFIITPAKVFGQRNYPAAGLWKL